MSKQKALLFLKQLVLIRRFATKKGWGDKRKGKKQEWEKHEDWKDGKLGRVRKGIAG